MNLILAENKCTQNILVVPILTNGFIKTNLTFVFFTAVQNFRNRM